MFIFITLGSISAFCEIVLICLNKRSSLYSKLNVLTFYGFALFLGSSVSTMGYVFDTKQSKEEFYSMCISALIMTGATFFTFTVFALLTSKRVIIYAGSAVLSLLLSVISWFVFDVSLYLIIGVIIAALYVIIDTQSIIHKHNKAVEHRRDHMGRFGGDYSGRNDDDNGDNDDRGDDHGSGRRYYDTGKECDQCVLPSAFRGAKLIFVDFAKVFLKILEYYIEVTKKKSSNKKNKKKK